MGQALRVTPGDTVYHMLNRANRRQALFDDEGDYAAFERVLAEAQQRVPMRLLAYCLMPNHWHLVLWPLRDGDLSRFMAWLTHTQRGHAHRHPTGTGHLYQGRFKSFLVQTDAHLLTVCRYVERNALRAHLVERAERWRWGSLWLRESGQGTSGLLVEDGPIARPAQWVEWVNAAETEPELTAVRQSVVRSQPFGETSWVEVMVDRLSLYMTQRPQGRPKMQKVGA
jgi:putative transposase